MQHVLYPNIVLLLLVCLACTRYEIYRGNAHSSEDVETQESFFSDVAHQLVHPSKQMISKSPPEFVEDTVICSESPNMNHGQSTVSQIDQAKPKWLLIRVSEKWLEGVVSGHPLNSAKLELTLHKLPKDSTVIEVIRMERQWSEFESTWVCLSGHDPKHQSDDCQSDQEWKLNIGYTGGLKPIQASVSALGGAVNPSISAVYEWNPDHSQRKILIELTKDVRDILNQRIPNLGWLIKVSNAHGNGHLEVSSRESIHPPALIIETGETHAI